MMTRSVALGLCAALAVMLTACGPADRTEDPLADVVGDEADLSRFAQGLESTGLKGVLEGEASYTLLAPSDEAFEALGADGAALFDDPERGAILAAVLREHMLPGALDPESMRATINERGGSVYVVSFGNGELSVEVEGEDLVVNTATGQRAKLGDVAVIGKNGVIIPIDAVLVDSAALAGQAGG